MGTWSALTVSEESYSAEENHDVTGVGTASVTLRCPWSLREAVVEDILANRRPWAKSTATNAPLATTASVVPAEHCEGTLVVGQSIEYAEALITVGYSTDAEADLVAETFEPNIEFITQDFRKFRWGSPKGDPLEDGEAPGLKIIGAKLVRTLYNVEPPLPISLLDEQGNCNGAAYTSPILGLTFPVETLLYGSPSLSTTITTSGVKGWNITMPFTYKRYGWNRYWRGDTEAWEFMYLAKTPLLPTPIPPFRSYPLGDFSDFLF